MIANIEEMIQSEAAARFELVGYENCRRFGLGYTYQVATALTSSSPKDRQSIRMSSTRGTKF